MKKWEVWWASYPFEEGKVEKIRPVIIVKWQGDKTLVIKMTSHNVRRQDPFDIPIRNWKLAGMRHPSVGRVSKITYLHNEKLIKRIGILSKADQKKIHTVYDKYLQEKERAKKEEKENRKSLDEQLKALHSSSPEKENRNKDSPKKEKEPDRER